MAAGAFALGSIFAFPAVAAADPAPPPAPVPGLTGTNDAYSPDPPANLPPQQGLLSPLEQSTGRGEGPAGLPTPLPDLQQGAVNEFVLAQNNTPSAPGTSPDTQRAPNTNALNNQYLMPQNIKPAAPGQGHSPDTQRAPNTNALNNQYLMPQNIKPAAPGQGQLFDVEPGEENADLTKTEALKHLWHGYQNGQYRGGFVNRGNKETLNQPLPGTAPPPGTRIPGLGDDSQGPPPEQWHWTPPEPPEGAAPAAPGAPPVPPAPPVPAPPA
ncbi:hypothetical protein [Mycobacteroides abscessus]|uniref:hypothetical protein n=1 Tax=Mycobacteroides abscessus TaxID=36809 RepID=UPI0013F5D347|nr:hypothetical protein [Mycobacteroides abscessus]